MFSRIRHCQDLLGGCIYSEMRPLNIDFLSNLDEMLGHCQIHRLDSLSPCGCQLITKHGGQCWPCKEKGKKRVAGQQDSCKSPRLEYLENASRGGETGVLCTLDNKLGSAAAVSGRTKKSDRGGLAAGGGVVTALSETAVTSAGPLNTQVNSPACGPPNMEKPPHLNQGIPTLKLPIATLGIKLAKVGNNKLIGRVVSTEIGGDGNR